MSSRIPPYFACRSSYARLTCSIRCHSGRRSHEGRPNTWPWSWNRTVSSSAPRAVSCSAQSCRQSRIRPGSKVDRMVSLTPTMREARSIGPVDRSRAVGRSRQPARWRRWSRSWRTSHGGSCPGNRRAARPSLATLGPGARRHRTGRSYCCHSSGPRHPRWSSPPVPRSGGSHSVMVTSPCEPLVLPG